MRWWRRMAGPIVAGMLFVGGLALVQTDAKALRFTDETPGDLRRVASHAWDRFVRAMPTCADRLDAPTVGVAWELPDRARYEPGTALVLVRAPGTAANLEATLLHEFTHHAERRCGVPPAIRRDFLAAGGLPAGASWRDGPAWDRTPSERFAEAVVLLVLGEQPPHVLVHVRTGELAVARAWARGE